MGTPSGLIPKTCPASDIPTPPAGHAFLFFDSDDGDRLKYRTDDGALHSMETMDATLDALAGENWAANSVPVGTGPDTVAQLVLGANTFLARASAGDVAAKSISDYGLALVAGADAAAARTALELGSAALADAGDFDPAGAAAAAQAASQPLDSDLSAIALLTTTGYGRSVLTWADGAAGRTALGLGSAALASSSDFDAAGAAATAQSNAEAYADSLVVGLWDDRGNYDASGNTYPASGGSGAAGAIVKGDIWTVSVAGTLGGHAVNVGDTVRALVDTPGSTDANWALGENNIGYVPLNAALNLSDVANAGTARTNLGLGSGNSPTFTGLTLSALTAGSILYAGASGVLSQDNSHLFYDATKKAAGFGGTTLVDPFGESDQGLYVTNAGAAGTDSAKLILKNDADEYLGLWHYSGAGGYTSLETNAAAGLYIGTDAANSTVTIHAGGFPNGTNLVLNKAGVGAGAFRTPLYMSTPAAAATGAADGSRINAFHVLNIEGEDIDASTGTYQGTMGVYVGHNFGGSSAKGGREGFHVTLNQTAKSGNQAAAIDTFFKPFYSSFSSAVNEGGTVGSPFGSAFGFNTEVTLNSGATYWNEIVAAEFNITATTGSSVAYKAGFKIVPTALDAVAGSLSNTALVIANQVGAVGWNMGISFGDPTGEWPMATSGTTTLIGTAATSQSGKAYAADHGVDFSSVTFSSDAFKSTGFSVDPDGDTLAKTLATTGDISAGADAGTARYIVVNGAAGNVRGIQWKTASSARWEAIAGSGAESGSDAGTSWFLRAYTDAGALIDAPITIGRPAGGAITLARPTTVSSGTLTVSGNISAAAWTTAGIALKTVAATYTDTSSSGTVAKVGVHVFDTPTLAASSATTYTAAATLLINGQPTAGSNVTITNPWALDVTGKTILRSGGNLQGNWSISAGALSLNVSSNFAVNIGTGTSNAGVNICGSGNTLGFFGVTAAARTGAFTQTYATASHTHSNLTSATLTDNTAGTGNTTLEALTSGAVYSTDVAAIRNNFADLAKSNNAIIVDLTNLKQVVNAVIDDLQSYGLLQ